MFLEIGLNSIDGVQVIYESLDLYEKGSENYNNSVKMIAATGGCCAIVVTPELLPLIMDGVDKMDHVGYCQSMQHLGLGPAIALSKETFSFLTKEEQSAIFFHELGHLRLGHLETAGNGIMDDVGKEIEADAYAAARTSKAVMASALGNIISGFVTLVGGVKGKSKAEQNQAIAELMAMPAVVQRLAALA